MYEDLSWLCFVNRIAWTALGEKSKADCMYEFITTLNKQCPLFKPFVEAHKRDMEEKERTRQQKIEQNRLENHESQRDEQQRLAEEQQERLEEQKRRIQDALNRQTFAQFKTYSEQQFPGNPEQV